MMRVFYGSRSGHAHRYQCRGDDAHVGSGLCVGIGGVRVDQAVAGVILEAVSDRAIEAAMLAAEQAAWVTDEIRQALEREIEEARDNAALAARRYDHVDPAKRHVARELEARWNAALERVAELEHRLKEFDARAAAGPKIDRAVLLNLANDLPAAWNATTTDARTKQRLIHLLIREVIISLDAKTNEAVVMVHWNGGQYTELRVARVRTGRYPGDRHPNPVEVIRRLGGQWPDRDLAVTMNRMRCRAADGKPWTTVRVKALRERLGIAPFDPDARRAPTISVDAAAQTLGICVGSVHRLIRQGILPASQLMPSAPWQVPVEALTSEPVRIGVQDIVARRPRRPVAEQEDRTLRLPA